MAAPRRYPAILALIALASACDNPNLIALRITGSSDGAAGADQGDGGAGATGAAGEGGTDTGGLGGEAGQAMAGADDGGAGSGGSGGDVLTSGASAGGNAGEGTAGDGGAGASAGAGLTGNAGAPGDAGAAGSGGTSGSGGSSGSGGASGDGGTSGGGGTSGSAGTSGDGGTSGSGGSSGSAGSGGGGPCVPSFTSTFKNNSGGIPGAIAVVDLNQGGYPDIVVAGQESSFTGVALPWYDNTGGRTLPTAQYLETPYNMRTNTLAVDDFDGDTFPDLAVSDRAEGFRIFINNGDATFAQPPPFYDSVLDLRSIVTADFDGINGPDVAFSAYANVWVRMNNGDGTFAAGTNYVAGAASVVVRSVTVGDFNGDTWPDFAMTTSLAIGVRMNNGDGTFGAQVDYPAGSTSGNVEGVRSIVAGDLDDDNDVDLTVVNTGGSTASAGVFLNDGSGTFAAQVRYPVTGSGSLLSGDLRAAIGDISRDGKVDIVMPTYDGNTVALLMGVGDGTFQSPVALSAGLAPNNVAIDDVDLDGFLDVVVSTNDPNNGNGRVMVFYSDTGCP